jgi:hypothetical protein
MRTRVFLLPKDWRLLNQLKLTRKLNSGINFYRVHFYNISSPIVRIIGRLFLVVFLVVFFDSLLYVFLVVFFGDLLRPSL